MSTTAPPPPIPTITLTPSTTTDTTDQILLLRETCRTTGFFYLDAASRFDASLPALLPLVLRHSRDFFSLPLPAKKRASDPVLNRGYTGMGEETLDPAVQRRGDTKEGFYIATDVGEDDPRYDPEKMSGPNVWPAEDRTCGFDCDEWKAVMTSYHGKMTKISFRLVQMLASALDLPHDYFDADFANPVAVLRLLHYSNERSDIPRGVFACGAHSDYGMVTLLATDDSPGLQIRTGGGWTDVPPPPPGTFVVNLGDMLERWTNGRFRSTVHRVVTVRSPGGGEGGDRYSIPFFYEPSFDTVVECLHSCLEEGGEDGGGARYPPVTSGRYLLDKYRTTYADFDKLEPVV